MADERRMLSRFGVWMMAALCPPNQNADPVGNSPRAAKHSLADANYAV